MPVKMLDATGVLRTITKLGVWDGSKLVPIARARVMDADGTTLRTVGVFTTPLAATASPTSARGAVQSAVTVDVTTGSVSIVATGGASPLTYAWTLLSHSAATAPTITSPSSATTTFRQASVASDTLETATFRCTITDATGQTATVNVPAEFEVFSFN